MRFFSKVGGTDDLSFRIQEQVCESWPELGLCGGEGFVEEGGWSRGLQAQVGKNERVFLAEGTHSISETDVAGMEAKRLAGAGPPRWPPCLQIVPSQCGPDGSFSTTAGTSSGSCCLLYKSPVLGPSQAAGARSGIVHLLCCVLAPLLLQPQHCPPSQYQLGASPGLCLPPGMSFPFLPTSQDQNGRLVSPLSAVEPEGEGGRRGRREGERETEVGLGERGT